MLIIIKENNSRKKYNLLKQILEENSINLLINCNKDYSESTLYNIGNDHTLMSDTWTYSNLFENTLRLPLYAIADVCTVVLNIEEKDFDMNELQQFHSFLNKLLNIRNEKEINLIVFY